jgi:hypothetical protein
MYFLFLALILQSPQHQEQITTPHTQSVPNPAATKPPTIEGKQNLTTPEMTPATALHFEHEITGQGMDLGTLKEKVAILEDKREKTDRPDINSLKTYRLYAGWIISFAVLGLGVIAYFRSFLWRSTLPYLREELRGNRHPPTAANLDLTNL